MKKIMSMSIVSLLTAAVLTSCAGNQSREPQQVVGNVGDKSVQLNNVVSNGKDYSKCWIERSGYRVEGRLFSEGDAAQSRRLVISYWLMGQDKFTKENSVIELSKFGYRDSNVEKYSRKTKNIVQSFKEEAQENCDVLQPGITGNLPD